MDRDEMRFTRRFCCALFVFFLIASTAANAFVFGDAQKLYQQGDFQNSYEILKTLSRANNAQAFFLLGKMHERGDGVSRDNTKAIVYYQRAVDLGLVEAVQRIEQLRGSETSIVLDWYLGSAWDGDVQSEFNLGYMYEAGMGVGIDEILALQWYEEAANQQHADAQLRLSMMLMAGSGTERDLVAGKKWLLAASKNGNEVANTLNLLLFQTKEKLDVVQIIQGLRTVNHSEPETMLHVLRTSVALAMFDRSVAANSDLAAPSIALLNANVGTEKNAATVSRRSNQNSRSMEPDISEQFLALQKTNSNLLFWLLSSFILIAICLIVVYFLGGFRFKKTHFGQGSGSSEFELKFQDVAYLPAPKENNKHGFIIPSYAAPITVNSQEVNRQKVNSQEVFESSVRYNPNNELITNVEIVLNKEIFESPNEVLKAAPLVGESIVGVKQKIKFDELLPKKLEDLSITPQGNMLSDIKYLASNNMQSVIGKDKDKDMENRKLSLRYIQEQTREFEAARIDDVDTVAHARLKIGLMFLQGEGVSINVSLAIKWLQRSAEMGNESAEAELSQLYSRYPEYVENESFEQQRIIA